MTVAPAAIRVAAQMVAPAAAAVLLVVALPGAPARAGTLVGISLAAAGATAWVVGRRVPGAFALLAAVALVLVGGGERLVSDEAAVGLALAAAPLVAPLLAGVVVGTRRMVLLALAAAVAAGPVRALVYDPFLDPVCASHCDRSSLAVTQATGWASHLLLAGGLVVAVALAVEAFRARRLALAVTAAAALAVAAGNGRVPLLVAGTVVALLLVRDTMQFAATRRRVAGLLDALGADTDVEATLRVAVGDPTLTVSYPVAADASRPTGGVTTAITVGDRLIARVHHDPRRVDAAALAAAVDGPALLAIEAASLEAEVAAQAAELMESRSRIVETADAERRRLERDVHDGAQQHVLALGLELRVAHDELPAGDRLRPILERCIAATGAALDELRALSHGIFPSVLDAAGLESALRTTAAEHGRAVAIDGAVGRLEPSLERAVFALVADQIDAAAVPLAVALERHGGRLEVRIEGATTPPREVVLDRIAAARGMLHRDGQRIVAVIPCA